jgi:hypothetical protein
MKNIRFGWLAALLLGGPVTGLAIEQESGMQHALVSGQPSDELQALDCPYHWLVGSWAVRVVDYTSEGEIHSEGEWHFAWVLEGRAMQDVWISPPRGARANVDRARPNRYGTSIRAYDPTRKQWRVTWINPVSGAYDTLWSRRDGTNVVQEGLDAEGRLMRWTFSDIAPRSAHWTGERSSDGGKTWKLEAEFFLTRD